MSIKVISVAEANRLYPQPAPKRKTAKKPSEGVRRYVAALPATQPDWGR
jgi:hypothetical protein